MRTQIASLGAAILLAATAFAAPMGAAPAMALINSGAWVQVLPVQDRSDTVLSASRAVPAGLTSVDMRMDVPVTGVAHPFILTSQQVNLTIMLSYDGGATFPDVETAPFIGSPTWNGTTGGWGKGGAPVMGLQFSPTRYPTNFKAGYSVVSGTVSFGISAQVD